MPLSFNIDPVLAGTARLTDAQALELYRDASLHDLGQWANTVTARMHPADYRTYVIDRNINYTNVCTAKCTFCGFRRDHEDADSYTLTYDTIAEKIRELVSIGGTQILMQGGMNDRLPLEWYEELLRFITTTFPTVHIHAFSPPEIVEFERFFSMDARAVIRRLKAAGLRTIPGGGGEIFNPRVRRRIGIGKCTGDDWLRVMRVAHEEGLDTSATMLIGHIETVQDRIDHMSALRDMQDYALALGSLNVDCGLSKDAALRTIAHVQSRHRASSRSQRSVQQSTINNQHSAQLEPLSTGRSSVRTSRSAARRSTTRPSTAILTRSITTTSPAAAWFGRLARRSISRRSPSPGFTSTTSPTCKAVGSRWGRKSVSSRCSSAPTTWAAR